MLTVNANLNTTMSPSSISINGGQVTIKGTGLPAVWPNTYYNNIQLMINARTPTILALNVVSTSPNEMVLIIPPVAASTTYTLTLTSPTSNIKALTIQQTTTNTPTVSLISPSSGPSGTFAIVLNRTVLTSE